MMSSSELITCRNLLDMLQDCNGEVADYWGMMLEHIDEQARQIATLKAALVCEREKSVELFWHPGIDFGELPAKRTCEAKEQLSQEYPDIKWEE